MGRVFVSMFHWSHRRDYTINMFECDSQQLACYRKCAGIREFFPIPRTPVGGAEIRRMRIYGCLSPPADSPLRLKAQESIPPIHSRIVGLTINPVIRRKICTRWQSGGSIGLVESPAPSTCSARESRTSVANYESRGFVVGVHRLVSSSFGSATRFIKFPRRPSRRKCLGETTFPADSRGRRRARRC